MSRGLGKLQREILDTLEDAKKWVVSDEGCTYRGLHANWGHAPDFHIHHGHKFILGDGVFDLRASMLYLATLHRAMEYEEPTPAFKSSFSRAARSLHERGLIEGRIDPQLRFVKLKR